MNTRQITSPVLHIAPSKTLYNYITGIASIQDRAPGLASIISRPKSSINSVDTNEKLLRLEDLHSLCQYIETENAQNESKVYLHELLQGSRILLPKNAEICRDPVLEARCRKLEALQKNAEYDRMTGDVNSNKKNKKEDSLAVQIKQINRHLVAVFQFVLSVVAGFLFGFVGVELIVGSLDTGFRLLLGIVFSLAIASAELYFLAKQLSD